MMVRVIHIDVHDQVASGDLRLVRGFSVAANKVSKPGKRDEQGNAHIVLLVTGDGRLFTDDGSP